MNKRFLNLLLTLLFTLLISACGGGGGDSSTPDSTPPTDNNSTPPTDNNPPPVDTSILRVTSNDPYDKITGVAIQRTINAVFSKDIDIASLNTSSFVVESAGGVVAGAVTYNSSTRTATFTPSAPLAKVTEFTVTLNTGLKDAQGVALGSDYSWSFKTGPIISAKEDHTLVLKSDGTLWSWGGDNHHRELGYDPIDQFGTIPAQIQGITGAPIAAIAAGGFHNLALRDDGTVIAWGDNLNGTLGIGESDQSQMEHGPVQVNISNVKAIAASRDHSLALKKDGTVWGWGKSYGNGADNHLSTPTRVGTLDHIVAIAAGGVYGVSLALADDGTVWAWGYNESKVLGNVDNTSEYSAVPLKIAGLNNVVEVALTWDSAIALKNDGTVWGWGRYTGCYFGNPEDDSKYYTNPIQIPGLSNIVSVGTTEEETYAAFTADGRVLTWGYNGNGVTGVGVSDGEVCTPTEPGAFGESIVTFTGGRGFSAVLKADGTVMAVGAQGAGQLGNGVSEQDPTNLPFEVGTF